MHKIQTTEEAFMSMAKRNEALIYRVCLSFTRQRHDEVQDLKQEILCNLWRGYGGFRPPNTMCPIGLANRPYSLQVPISIKSS